MKIIKWISLVALIISLIITGILFAKFVNSREVEPQIQNTKITKIYKEHLYRKAHNIFENGELFLDVKVIENGGYIVFDEQQVSYCDSENICNSSNYIYNDENSTISVESYNGLLNRGTYNINIKEDTVELSIEKENRKTIYYFDMPQK